MAIEQRSQTMAAFVLNDGKAARRLLENIEKVDAVDGNVEIIDAAIVDRSKRGRIVVHQTRDKGALKGGAKGAGIGVVVGAIVLGPAGAVLGGAAGGILNGVRNRLHDVGIDDKFMRELGTSLPEGGAALFVLVRQVTPDKVIPRISEYGGKIIQSSLSTESEQRLQEALSATGATA